MKSKDYIMNAMYIEAFKFLNSKNKTEKQYHKILFKNIQKIYLAMQIKERCDF